MAIWGSKSIMLSLACVLCSLLCLCEGQTVTSSSWVNRDFVCSAPVEGAFRQPCPGKNKTLYIQGFVPATNDVFESETIVPAAYAAIDDINADCTLLPDYLLQLDFVNTECDPSEATWQLIDSIVLQAEGENQPKIAFLGGGCSLATEPVAALSGRFYKIPQISYGASSPSLSQRNLFPRFIRTIPSEVQANKARFALMRLYNWTRVATLHETQTIFSLAIEDFSDTYDRIFQDDSEEETDNEEGHVLRSFTDDPEIPLGQIMDKDIRIIFGYFYEDKAINALCQAYKMNLTTENHLWMFPAWFTSGWWDVDVEISESYNCTRADMRNAVLNSFYLDSYLYGFNKSDMTETGTSTANEFDDKYDCYLEEFRNNSMVVAPGGGRESLTPTTEPLAEPHIYRTFSYDAVWTIALALDATDQELAKQMAENPNNPDFDLSLDNFTYFDENNISSMISDFMQQTSFTGISGEVSFDVNGTREGLNAIYQLVEVNGSDSLELVLLAVHDPSVANNTPYGFNTDFDYILQPVFKFNSSTPPRDRRMPNNKFMNTSLVYVCCIVAGLAIIVGVALLVFNLVTICKPLIRDSAPHINTIVIVGCIWMLVACFLLSVDSNNPPVNGAVDQPRESVSESDQQEINDRYKIICMLRLWFLTIGFTLSFGALFAKTWQVYRVYTNPKLQKEPFKMWNFFIIMGIFLTIDIAYLIFWTTFDPFTRRTERQTDESADVDNFHEVCYCEYYPYLIGALYVYKGLLVVFGLFLAYESRNVKYYYINDSRFVSIAMYIVVILVGIGAPLSLVLAVHYFTDAAYALAIFMVVGSSLSCMLILFIPKFVFMARGKETMVRENEREEITVSDGLQLGRTTIDQSEMNNVENEIDQLKQENAKKDLELQELQEEVLAGDEELGGKPNPPSGSDGDSGVLVVDENEVFSTESTANEETTQRSMVNTPSSSTSSGDPPLEMKA